MVGHLVPAGSVFAFLAEHRGEVFPWELFADLFPSSTGRPSLRAEIAASVLVLQTLQDLSDRERCGGGALRYPLESRLWSAAGP